MSSFKNTYKKMLVALDLSPMDKKVVKYCGLITESFGVKSGDFVHVVPILFPEDARGWKFEDFLELDESLPARIQSVLEAEIQPLIKKIDPLKSDLVVLEGKPYWELINRIEEENIDLLVMGKKKYDDGSGVNARRIARKATCALWFVTEKSSATIGNIVVPVDFSDFSARALKTALLIKKNLPKANVLCLHIINLPNATYNLNDDFLKASGNLKNLAKQSFENFLDENDISGETIKFASILNDEHDIAGHIQKWSTEQKADLIVQGAIGHTPFDDFLYGSVTEKLLTYESDIPILIIR